MKPFSIIVAMEANRGIGKEGKLPWALPGDMAHFKQLTCQTTAPGQTNAVIMGRKTWDSLPQKFRPLPGRLNIVLTQQDNFRLPEDVVCARDFLSAFKAVEEKSEGPKIENIFVIGGSQIFRQAIQSKDCQRLLITHIKQQFSCDAFFPPFLNRFKEVQRSENYLESGLEYFFAEYAPVNPVENS